MPRIPKPKPVRVPRVRVPKPKPDRAPSIPFLHLTSGGDIIEQTCTCSGRARVLEGNSRHIGSPGGFGIDHIINENSAAIIPSQFGGKGNVRPFLEQVSGTVDGDVIFDNIADVIGGKPPKGFEGENVREALQVIFPETLILELPGGKDLGIVDIVITQPCALACPVGTQ